MRVGACTVREHEGGNGPSERPRVRLSAQCPEGASRVFAPKLDVRFTCSGANATAVASLTDCGEVRTADKEQAGGLNPALAILAEVKHSEFARM